MSPQRDKNSYIGNFENVNDLQLRNTLLPTQTSFHGVIYPAFSAWDRYLLLSFLKEKAKVDFILRNDNNTGFPTNSQWNHVKCSNVRPTQYTILERVNSISCYHHKFPGSYVTLNLPTTDSIITQQISD